MNPEKWQKNSVEKTPCSKLVEKKSSLCQEFETNWTLHNNRNLARTLENEEWIQIKEDDQSAGGVHAAMMEER